MMRLFKTTLVACAAFAAALSSAAAAKPDEISLGAPFSSGMVLQRGQSIPIWGGGKAGSVVEVRLDQEMQSGKVDSNGKWQVEFTPREAANGLILSIDHDGKSLEFKDIAIGDVFLCSGQSNMVWKMSSSALRPEDRKPAIDQQIRHLTVPWITSQVEQSQFGESAVWKKAADDWADFSAVCLLAGREIAKSEGVIVGLINASVGGTPIRAWLPYEGIALAGGMEDQMAVLNAYRQDPVAAQAEHGAVLDDLWLGRPSPSRSRKGREGYANLFNGMVAPLGPTRLTGAIWYQGENNANNAEGTISYRRLLDSLISSWRGRFGGKVPFVIVQLAGFGTLSGVADSDEWAAVREAQRLVARDDPRTELVVTIDVGERLDIHPPLKKPVGHRAAAALLKLAYGKPDAYLPPEPLSARRVDDGVEISISQAKAPLFAASWGRPGPFMVCEDALGKVCSFADAQFTQGGIVVAVPVNLKPYLVRYCWDAAPICNVFDQSEMPLGPFELLID